MSRSGSVNEVECKCRYRLAQRSPGYPTGLGSCVCETDASAMRAIDRDGRQATIEAKWTEWEKECKSCSWVRRPRPRDVFALFWRLLRLVSLNPDTVPRLQRNPERACPCLPWFYGRSARQIPIVPSTTDVIFPGLSGNGNGKAAPDGQSKKVDGMDDGCIVLSCDMLRG